MSKRAAPSSWVDLLVNDAGQSLFGPLAELPLARLDAVYRTDLRGRLAVAQAVVPAMAAQRWGRIANVGSMFGVVPTPWTGAYCAFGVSTVRSDASRS